MKTLLVASTASLALLSVLALPREAHAQDPVPTAAAPAPAAATPQDRDKVTPVEAEPAFKPVAITLNPLSLAIMRIGVNVEYLPATHHGIMINPYFQSISADGGSVSTSYSNFGGELGYHYYTGSKGANGFFVGPSVLFMQSSITSKSTLGGAASESTGSATSYGAALDFGGQHVFDNGFTIGGGAGLMYLASSTSATNLQTSSTAKFEGVLPRFLFTAGYSF